MLIGIRSVFKNVVWELKTLLLHCRGLVLAYQFRNNTDLKLNLGCGRKTKEGWINIDLNRTADLSLDLREQFPFKNNSCSIIYSEHFMEHLDYPGQVKSFLKEAYRVLRPGGIFSVGVPDAELSIRAYTEKLQFGKNQWHPDWCNTKMEHINYAFRQGNEHRFAYDFETMKHILEKSGFIEVKRRDFNYELDSDERKLGTLYVEAIKSVADIKSG